MIEHLKKSKGGFTLVELIVVIAILAILSGIAVPVYSGYISKANEAGDLQLLGALNTAYTAACAEMGLDPTGIIGLAALSGDAGAKKVTQMSAAGDDVDNDALNRAFFRFYAGNENSAFKYFTSLGYDRANGVFVDGSSGSAASFTGYDAATGMYSFTYLDSQGNEHTLSVSAADLNAYADSNIADISSRTLMSTVNGCAQAVGNVFSSSAQLEGCFTAEELAALNLDKNDPNYKNKLANALVLKVAAQSNDLITADAFLNQIFDSAYPTDIETLEDYNAYRDTLDAKFDAIISEINEKVENNEMTIEEAMEAMTDMLNGGVYPDGIINNVLTYKVGANGPEIDYSATATKAAALYGLVTGYASENGNTIVTYYEGDDFDHPQTATVAELYAQINTALADSQNAGGMAALGAMIGVMDKLMYSPLMIENQNCGQTMNSDFAAYMNSASANADINGYLAAMSIISDNSSNINQDDLFNNGFGDEGLQALVAAILGG